MSAKTLILGVGNYLQSDDGVSVHALADLQSSGRVPEHVDVVDGGTCGLDLLHFLEGVEKLVLVDAVHSGCAAGTIIKLRGDEVPAYLALKISPHDIGLPDLMATARLRDLYPPQVVVVGIEPQSLDFGVDLSPVVAARLPDLNQAILAEIQG